MESTKRQLMVVENLMRPAHVIIAIVYIYIFPVPRIVATALNI